MVRHFKPGSGFSFGFLNTVFEKIINVLLFLWEKIRYRKLRFAVFVCFILFVIFTVNLVFDFHRVQELAEYKPEVTTKIYDKNNNLISELYKEKRKVVPYEKIPQNLVNALMAIEDNEYLNHWGINVKGIIRAFFINLFSGSIRQGGSTLTQQTAKILLTSGERTINRKIKEAGIAVIMEFTYSKEKILELYLNQIYCGKGAYGVEIASQLYFRHLEIVKADDGSSQVIDTRPDEAYGKHVWELDLAESALLAGMISAPSRLNPISNLKTASRRHRVVLSKMVELGFVTAKEAEDAYMNFWEKYQHYYPTLPPSYNVHSLQVDNAPWFTGYIREQLVHKYGEKVVYEEGLDVYTTLDINKQVAGEKLLKERLKRQTIISSSMVFKNDDYIVNNFHQQIKMIELLVDLPSFRKKGSNRNKKINTYYKRNIVEEFEILNFFAGTDDIGEFIDDYKKYYLDERDFQKVEGALITINQNNGYIETMIGGSEYSSINRFNRAMKAKRQPGSSIKPLLYAAAIESKQFTAATTILDSPVVFLESDRGDWLPENYEGEFYGFVRLRKALAMSINVVSINIAQKLGLDMVITYIGKFLHLNKKEAFERIPHNLSIALGSVEVTPFELTRAYAIIANRGRDVIPFAVRYIKNRDGKILENREKEVKSILRKRAKKGTLQVIRPETAQIMTSLLRGVVMGGTGAGANPGRPAAGKTGTTNSYKDAWFVGFTPDITTGLWIGYDKMGLSLGAGQAGGAVAAPLWGAYMREAHKGHPVRYFPSYARLVQKKVCYKSGLVPSENCTYKLDEYFIPGTEPDEKCSVCNESSLSDGMAKKGPKDNISKDQKKTINKLIKKDNDSSIIENIGDELLN